MASFGTLLDRRNRDDPKDNVWKQNKRRFGADSGGRARAAAVQAIAGERDGASSRLYGKGDGSGRARIITFMLVGKGRFETTGLRDTSPTSADLAECVEDYGLSEKIQNNPDLLSKWLLENVYPIPSGYPKSTFHMIYYNPTMAGGERIFNWSAFTGVLRKFILQPVVHVKKGGDSARTVMRGLMRVMEIYKKHLNVINEEEDPWCQLIKAYFIWYSQAHLAFGGSALVNPFAERQWGPDGGWNIVGLLKKSHKDASAAATGVAKSAIFAVAGYQDMAQHDHRIPFYRNAFRSAVQASIMSGRLPSWATSLDQRGQDIATEAFGNILKTMQATFSPQEDNISKGFRAGGGERQRKVKMERKPRTIYEIEETARRVGATRKAQRAAGKSGPRLSASARAGASNAARAASRYRAAVRRLAPAAALEIAEEAMDVNAPAEDVQEAAEGLVEINAEALAEQAANNAARDAERRLARAAAIEVQAYAEPDIFIENVRKGAKPEYLEKIPAGADFPAVLTRAFATSIEKKDNIFSFARLLNSLVLWIMKQPSYIEAQQAWKLGADVDESFTGPQINAIRRLRVFAEKYFNIAGGGVVPMLQ